MVVPVKGLDVSSFQPLLPARRGNHGGRNVWSMTFLELLERRRRRYRVDQLVLSCEYTARRMLVVRGRTENWEGKRASGRASSCQLVHGISSLLSVSVSLYPVKGPIESQHIRLDYQFFLLLVCFFFLLAGRRPVS